MFRGALRTAPLESSQYTPKAKGQIARLPFLHPLANFVCQRVQGRILSARLLLNSTFVPVYIALSLMFDASEKRVCSPFHARLTVPVGPLRCLAMMICESASASAL